MKKIIAQNKLSSTLLLILAFLSLVFFVYAKLTSSQLKSAKSLESSTFELQQINYKIESEVTRCNKLLAEGEGKFDEYEYCSGFVKYFSSPKVSE